MEDLHIKEVDEIPVKPRKGETFLIKGNGISDFTHGIFKYPCKFIPHIPRWFIQKYADKNTIKYGIIDPFVGSGTTIVESSLLGFPSFGVDIDPLSCLLSRVKSESFSKKEIKELTGIVSQFQADLGSKKITNNELKRFIPDFNNLNHWFSDDAIVDLAKIKYLIDLYFL